jgi:hypothetical protein
MKSRSLRDCLGHLLLLTSTLPVFQYALVWLSETFEEEHVGRRSPAQRESKFAAAEEKLRARIMEQVIAYVINQER